jgi:SAM-dependent methyltransferase
MGAVAPTNRESAEAWSGVLFDRWVAFRDVVTTQIAPFSETAFRISPPPLGGRVLDIGCGLGDTTLRLAEKVGPGGEAVGMDVGDRFVETATAEAEAAGVENVSYLLGDAQVADLGEGFDYVFSRFGCMFFASPVAALRNIRRAMVPGGRLCLVVWRSKAENEWLQRAELVAEKYLEEPDETDEPTCGPGPFSMANADTTSEVLLHAGFDDIALHRQDVDYRIGPTMDKAIALVTALGPAGELIRLAGDSAEDVRPQLEADLREAYADLERPDGVYGKASVWIVTAEAPA